MSMIDLRYLYDSPGLYARQVWQVLFDHYREAGGNLDDMASLLCDLGILRRAFESDKNFHLEFEFTISGCTWLCESTPNPALIIERVEDKVFINPGSGHGQMLIA